MLRVRYEIGRGCVKHKGMGQVGQRQLRCTVEHITARREDKGIIGREEKMNRKERN